MKRTDNEDGSYILTADAGRDLTVLDTEGNPIDRCKEVTIPTIGTLNTWVEVAELPPTPEVVVMADPVQQQIADLEARLVQLKAEVAQI